MPHIKNKWTEAEALLEPPAMQQEEISILNAPMDFDTTLFGGPIFNEEAKEYNRCFPFLPEFQEFLIPPYHITTGLEYVLHVKSYSEYFKQIQASIGRIAIYKDNIAAFPHTFLSGFFISSTKFVTRTHHFSKTAVAKITLAAEAHGMLIVVHLLFIIDWMFIGSSQYLSRKCYIFIPRSLDGSQTGSS